MTDILIMENSKQVKSVLVRSPKAVGLINRRAAELGISASAAAAVTIVQSLGNHNPQKRTSFLDESVEKNRA